MDARTIIRHMAIGLIVSFAAGCNFEMKVSIGSGDKDKEKAANWQVYATNKRTQIAEYWLSWHESRSDCLKALEYQLTDSMTAQWYGQPAGCMYIGGRDPNQYSLYLLNRWFNANVFWCVAKRRADGALTPLLQGARQQTDIFYCVLPESPA